jgi:hypothetical protein
VNAANKGVYAFVEENFIVRRFDETLPHVKQLADSFRDASGWVQLDCRLVRAVAIDGW